VFTTESQRTRWRKSKQDGQDIQDRKEINRDGEDEKG
jgi:hypothetical protein